MRLLKEIYRDAWDFGCTVQPVMTPMILWEGVRLSARDVLDTYEAFLHIVPDGNGQQEIPKGDVRCPFFADWALVPRGILGSKEYASGGKLLKTAYVIRDLEGLKDSYQEFLQQVETVEQTFSYRKEKKGEIEVTEAPLLSLVVRIGESDWFPVSVIRDTKETFDTVHPIPVPGEKEGRFADDFSDPSFAEYLAKRKIFGKGKSKRKALCYWIEDEEAYETLISQIFSLVGTMEKERTR